MQPAWKKYYLAEKNKQPETRTEPLEDKWWGHLDGSPFQGISVISGFPILRRITFLVPFHFFRYKFRKKLPDFEFVIL